jgi:CRP/FNR family cyclic AMP-dependent transcriptional regulator
MRKPPTTTRHDELRALPLFGQATPRELDAIASLTTTVRVDAGRVLVTEGTVGREFFVVESGEAVVSAGGTDVALLGPGAFFGEIALLGHELRTATVRALSPMTVLVLTPAEFHELVKTSPSVREQLEAARDARKEETSKVLAAAA